MARPHKRKVVTELLTSISIYDLDGPLDETIDELGDILEKHGYVHGNIRCDIVTESYGCCDEAVFINVLGDREETEKEYEKRVEKLKKERVKKKEKKILAKKKQELFEKRLLKEYRAKYEG
jgi:uncharacterized protein YifE (UPF0438 family)